MPPALEWADARGSAMIGNGIRTGEGTWAPKLGKHEASATPPAFRDVLLAMARSAAGAVDE
jgi:hypothetical protein